MSFGQPARINTLPFEVLSSIFIALVDVSICARSIGDHSYGFCEYPTLISSVCAHWRRVSIGIPQLWTYIDLMPFNDRMRNLEHVKLWLKRSQNLPLQLRLGKGGEQAEKRSDLMHIYALLEHLEEPLASILASAAPRVQSFTLKFERPDFATEALSALLPAEGQHSIRELAIRQARWARLRLPEILPQREWARLLEPLRILHLERCNISLDSIPCRNLVELQLVFHANFSPLTHLIQLIESNPGLHTIVLEGVASEDIPLRPISLPSLRRVQFLTSRKFMEHFFQALIPGTHELELRLGCIEKPTPGDTSLGDTMASFFQRTRVRSLSLQPVGLLLPSVLASLSHLQSLELANFGFDHSTLAGLEPATNLLPKLHTIDLNECVLAHDSTLLLGLRTLLSLPSVRRIRHRNYRDYFYEGARDRILELLEGGRFAATITPASAEDFEYASPFR